MTMACLAAALLGFTCQQPAAAPLCVDGHPAKRRPDITYGGKTALHGYERDHWMPLELGGPDTPENVKYQRCALVGAHGRCLTGPAAEKNDDEHIAGATMCAGEWSQTFAQQWLAARWPPDPAHGYDR